MHTFMCDNYSPHTQILNVDGIAVDWKKNRHGRRAAGHQHQAKVNRFKRRSLREKSSTVNDLPLHPTARQHYLSFLGVIDLTT